MNVRVVAGVPLLVVLAWSSAASADAKAADKAFRKGKKLLTAKQYPEACAAFEESFREDPAIGAQLNVARCYEEWGKTATAHAAYKEALALARATKDDRASQIKELVDRLGKAVPSLVVKLPTGRLAPLGLSVTLDDAELPLKQLGKSVPADPGPHVVVIRTGDGAPQTLHVTAIAGQRTAVELPIDREPPSAPPPEAEPAEPPPPHRADEADAAPPGHRQRVIAVILGGVGVVGLGSATWLGLRASGDYHDAFDAHCDADSKLCDAEGVTLTRDARSRANLATVIGGVSVAAVTTGVVLYLLAPKAEHSSEVARQVRYLRPIVSNQTLGVAFGGSL